MKTIVPLAGKDLRFESLGVYKPLIIIGKKPLIYHVLTSNGTSLDNLCFIVLHEHEKKFGVTNKLKNYFGQSTTVVVVPSVAEGAPCSILQAHELINDDEDILIDLGDVIRTPGSLLEDISSNHASGIVPIDPNHVAPVWGYITTQGKRVTQLLEKITTPIKGGATLGLYYFSSGSEYIKYSQLMMLRGKRTTYTGYYYVGPVYNEYIADQKVIGFSKMGIKHVLGSPHQIDLFIQKYKI